MIMKRKVSKQWVVVVILNNALTVLLQDSSVWTKTKFKGDYDFEDTYTLTDDEDYPDFDWGEEMEQLNDTTTPDPDPVLLLNDTDLPYRAVEGIQIIVHKIKTTTSTTWCHLNGPVGHLALLIDKTCSGKDF